MECRRLSGMVQEEYAAEEHPVSDHHDDARVATQRDGPVEPPVGGSAEEDDGPYGFGEDGFGELYSK